MITKILTLSFVLFTVKYHSQSFTINGFVYDGHISNRLAFANVYLVQKKRLTETDKDGFFKFTDLEKGYYTLKCSYLGNGDTTLKNINIHNDTIKINLRTCYNVIFGGNSECPKCNKTDMIIPIKYGNHSKKDYAKSKKGQLYLLTKPSHCKYRLYCKRDSITY